MDVGWGRGDGGRMLDTVDTAAANPDQAYQNIFRLSFLTIQAFSYLLTEKKIVFKVPVFSILNLF